MWPEGLNFLFTLSYPPRCSLCKQAVSSPPYVIFVLYCLCPSPNSRPLWPERNSRGASQDFPIGLLCLPTFLSPVTTLPWMFSFLYYLFLASPSPKAKMWGWEGVSGEQEREETRKGGTDGRTPGSSQASRDSEPKGGRGPFMGKLRVERVVRKLGCITGSLADAGRDAGLGISSRPGPAFRLRNRSTSARRLSRGVAKQLWLPRHPGQRWGSGAREAREI